MVREHYFMNICKVTDIQDVICSLFYYMICTMSHYNLLLLLLFRLLIMISTLS